MLPPPVIMLHVPPAGEPTNAFVVFSQIDAALVVLLDILFTLTVKVTSLVVAGQPPLAAMVYRIVTLVFEATFAGV